MYSNTALKRILGYRAYTAVTILTQRRNYRNYHSRACLSVATGSHNTKQTQTSVSRRTDRKPQVEVVEDEDKDNLKGD